MRPQMDEAESCAVLLRPLIAWPLWPDTDDNLAVALLTRTFSAAPDSPCVAMTGRPRLCPFASTLSQPV